MRTDVIGGRLTYGRLSIGDELITADRRAVVWHSIALHAYECGDHEAGDRYTATAEHYERIATGLRAQLVMDGHDGSTPA